MGLKNAKAKGSRNEHKSIEWLEAQGYRCTRAAASLGEWDIVAVGVTDVVLVQTKSNRWPRSEEMARLLSFHVPVGVRKEIHRWKDYARSPEVREVA